jgi:hypothetical protein
LWRETGILESDRYGIEHQFSRLGSMVDSKIAVDDIAHTDKDRHFSHSFKAILVGA